VVIFRELAVEPKTQGYFPGKPHQGGGTQASAGKEVLAANKQATNSYPAFNSA